jgi:pilus assembly protein CpaB
MRMKNIIILCVALIMGGLAAFLARNWLLSHSRSSSAATGTIVVAAKPLGYGAAVTADNIAEIAWAARALPEGAFVTKEELLGDGRRVVLTPLASNEPVLRSKITGPGQRASLSSFLQEGNRAVTVRVDDVRGVAGFILPGDFVDVVLIKTDDERVRRENYSEILLQRVKVLAIDQLSSERQEQPTIAKAVTLEVAPEQAQKILLATNVGKLSLILRQPEEKSLALSRRITEKDLRTSKISDEPPPVPLPQVAEPVRRADAAATVAIVRGLKREEYKVMRDGYWAGSGFWPEALTQATTPSSLPSSPLSSPLAGTVRTVGKAD